MERLPKILERDTGVTWYPAVLPQWNEGGWYRPLNKKVGVFASEFDGRQDTVSNDVVTISWERPLKIRYELPQSYWSEAYGNNLG